MRVVLSLACLLLATTTLSAHAQDEVCTWTFVRDDAEPNLPENAVGAVLDPNWLHVSEAGYKLKSVVTVEKHVYYVFEKCAPAAKKSKSNKAP